MYIPEPTSLLLIGESLVLLALVARDRRRPEAPPPAIIPPVIISE